MDSAGLSWAHRYSADENDTTYDRALTNITPFLSAVWLKGNSTENSSSQGWWDARFICMRNNQVQEGSQEPGDVPSLAVTVVADSLGKSAPLVVSIIVTFLLW